MKEIESMELYKRSLIFYQSILKKKILYCSYLPTQLLMSWVTEGVTNTILCPALPCGHHLSLGLRIRRSPWIRSGWYNMFHYSRDNSYDYIPLMVSIICWHYYCTALICYDVLPAFKPFHITSVKINANNQAFQLQLD